MDIVIPVGTKGTNEIKVTEKNTAKFLGSGTLEVFATPAMICLMENTAAKSIENFLEAPYTSVGISVNIKHLAPSAVGKNIKCESTVISQDRAKITFEIKAYDEKGVIGEGIHERFIVNGEKFMEKALS